jgi:hypothetical protein
MAAAVGLMRRRCRVAVGDCRVVHGVLQKEVKEDSSMTDPARAGAGLREAAATGRTARGAAWLAGWRALRVGRSAGALAHCGAAAPEPGLRLSSASWKRLISC